MTAFKFRLYVMAGTLRSRNAEQQLRALCESRLSGRFEIDVVDVAARPDRADAERIVATPTVDRIEPAPRVRVIGDLTSPEQLAAVFDLPKLAEDLYPTETPS